MKAVPGCHDCAGCEDGSLHAWETHTGKRLMQLRRAHSTRIRGLVVLPSLPDSQSLSNGTADGTALPDRSADADFDSAADYLALPDTFATAASDGTVKLWVLRAGKSASGRCAEP